MSLAGSGCRTDGAVLINKIRVLDLTALKARRIERAPQVVVDDVLARLTAILEG